MQNFVWFESPHDLSDGGCEDTQSRCDFRNRHVRFPHLANPAVASFVLLPRFREIWSKAWRRHVPPCVLPFDSQADTHSQRHAECHSYPHGVWMVEPTGIESATFSLRTRGANREKQRFAGWFRKIPPAKGLARRAAPGQPVY